MQDKIQLIETTFDRWVRKKYNVFNSIFLNLPFEKISSFGMLIPLICHTAAEGLKKGEDPRAILNDFFDKHTALTGEEQKIEFMFNVIRYVERQVVLFDSIEDSAFPKLHEEGNELSVSDYIHLAERQDIKTNFLEKLASYSIRLVFTAHPTQFYPPAVLDIIARLKILIDHDDLNGVDLCLQQLGMTPLLNQEKPTPVEEARNIIYYLRHVYYDSLAEFFRNIEAHLPGRHLDNPGLIRLGFWPGGDRDGNPFVTAGTSMQVADELRTSLMKCYYNDLKDLEKKITFKGAASQIASLRGEVYEAMFDNGKVISFDHLRDTLAAVAENVRRDYNSLYLEDIECLRRKIGLFRTHFATLDIRQDHSVHKMTVEAVLSKHGIIQSHLGELTDDDLLTLLLEAKLKADPGHYDDPLVKDTLLNISQLREIQQKNGEWGCNRYIISNSEDVFSVLFVYALFRWTGYDTGRLAFDIIPLFETMEGMKRAEGIMRSLFGNEAYRAHLRHRGDTQTIMLGFSDGTKDGGYFMANWSIFRSKEVLSALCNEFDLRAVFFDGRGGPPARGGGKTHRFYAAQTDTIANHEIQLTIQGQTITSRFGTPEQFIHNCDQLLTAGLSRGFLGNDNHLSEHSRALIEALAETSYDKYLSLKNHKLFIPYLENKSTLKYYSEANIGSRPSRRGNKKDLELKDLRAIPFVGSWSQLKQNVPGYYGLGTALHTLAEQGKTEDLIALFRNVPYFKALILNSMMSLEKCNFDLTAHHSQDPVYGEFWKMLHSEYLLSKEMVLKISGYTSLMQEEPVTKLSIGMREQIVLPLLITQQYALQMIEAGGDKKEAYEKIVTRSLYGNINASRNSV